MNIFVRLVYFSVFLSNVLGANVLFITVLCSPSHHIWNEVLVDGLLKRGHNITLIGHEDANIRSDNYTVLKITGINEILQEMDVSDLINSKLNAYQDMQYLWYLTSKLAEFQLQSKALEKLLTYPRDIFDLIVFDVAVGQYYYPLIEYFGNPPVVGVSPFSLPPYILDTMGSHFYSYIPVHVLNYTDEMSFFQRLENIFLYLADYFMKWQTMADLYKMSQARFGKNIVPFDQVEKQIGILLANYDPILDFPQPIPPHIIPVGGLHIKPQTQLPNDIQHILDNANDGVIYFSLGTNIQPSWLATDRKEIFLNTFSKLKKTVLWKYDGNDLKNVPKNVVIRKWFPQNNILGHKNTKLFITHGGLLSTQETSYHGIPVIAIPFFIDQKQNAGKIEARNLGKKLHINTLTESSLYNAIEEVLSQPIYRENMQRISKMYKDQKESPIERAVFWVEYTLRHRNISHLSGRGRYLTVYQRENVDLYGFIFICAIIFILTLFVIAKFIIKRYIFHKSYKIKQN